MHEAINSDSSSEMPILVSGVPRSGTTWMQHYLSQHPEIQIHGQPPQGFHWSLPYSWYETLLEKGAWSQEANQGLDYDALHYAGASPESCAEIFRSLYRDFITGFGPGATHWGLKYIGLCCHPEWVNQFDALWPNTRWVIGVRNPFHSLNSLRNTFAPDYDMVKWIGEWLAAYDFATQQNHPRIFCFDIDRLAAMTNEDRFEQLAPLWNCLGLKPSPEVDDYVVNWPRIHEVQAHEDRQQLLKPEEVEQAFEAYPQLKPILDQEGYDYDAYQGG